MAARTAKKSSSAPRPSGLGRLLGSRLFWSLALLALVGVGSYSVWRQLQPRLQQDPRYQLHASAVEITPLPEWIRSDIKSEALRNASLDGALSLLDEQLAPRLSRAFELHPWVRRVARVRKLPQGVRLEIVYREPVLMVEVPGGLFAVDVEGVLLPSADFRLAEARRYPRLSGIRATTAGPVGAKWLDGGVSGAAQIAAELADHWRDWDLLYIAPLKSDQAVRSDEPAFEMFTNRGTRIVWGSATSKPASSTNSTTSGEPTTAEKLARLRAIVSRDGSLDSPGGPQDIDLRRPEGTVSTPRVAERPAKPDPSDNSDSPK